MSTTIFKVAPANMNRHYSSSSCLYYITDIWKIVKNDSRTLSNFRSMASCINCWLLYLWRESHYSYLSSPFPPPSTSTFAFVACGQNLHSTHKAGRKIIRPTLKAWFFDFSPLEKSLTVQLKRTTFSHLGRRFLIYSPTKDQPYI